MSEPVLVVSSVTYAIKGRDLLMRKGISARTKRISNLTENGCVWGIGVARENEKEAVRILQAKGIMVLKNLALQKRDRR